MKKILLLPLLLAIAVSFFVLRPPHSHNVYRIGSGEEIEIGGTAVLVQDGDCLLLSTAESAFVSPEYRAADDDTVRLIAVSDNIRVVETDGGPTLQDSVTGQTVKIGEGFEGRMAFPAPRFEDGGRSSHMWTVGWPITSECGNGLALVVGIDRVIPRPANAD